MYLKEKKLLVMGGSVLSCEIVKKAQAMGIYVVVTDWYSENKSPAKKIADKSFMISTANVSQVCNLIEEENIDGVITGFTDSTLQYYQQVCEKLKLPCYITEDQINITTNKRKFKNMCNQFSIPIVEEYYIKDIYSGDYLHNIVYPVIVKPVDNSGARGIAICRNKKELIIGYENALKFSESKSVIIERYMECKEATIFYLFNNGEVYLTGIGDRHIKHNQDGVIPLPVAYTFPSLYIEGYLNEINQKVKKMFNSLGMKNGMVFIQSFVEDGKFIFYEMGYRLTGSLEYKIMERIIGVNHLQAMIEFSLTGKTKVTRDYKNITPKYKKFGANISFLVKPGAIGRIEGIDILKKLPGVIDAFPSYVEGDIIPESAKGTLQQIVLRVFCISDTIKELKNTMDLVHANVKVTSSQGENMLLKKFDTEELLNARPI